MAHKITKLILPMAGVGRRLRPLTLRTPKNLIKVNGKPLVEYTLDEAVRSGIKEVVLILNPKHKKAFKAYLARNKKKFSSLKFHIREQATPGGNGHAIVQAYDLLEGGPFVVRFCDDVIKDETPIIGSMIKLFEAVRSPLVLLERVPKKIVSRFGVVGVKRAPGKYGGQKGKVYRITKIIEKPKSNMAPSNLTIVGGYVLTHEIIKNLKSIADTLPIMADDALPLAVALQINLIIGGDLYGWEFPGKRLDCGTLEKLEATEKFLGRVGSR